MKLLYNSFLLVIKYALIVFCIAGFYHNISAKENHPLSTIYISVDTSELNFSDYIDCKVSYLINGNETIFTEEPSFLKYRGNASAHYDKKSFSIKFNKSKCFYNMACNKK